MPVSIFVAVSSTLLEKNHISKIKIPIHHIIHSPQNKFVVTHGSQIPQRLSRFVEIGQKVRHILERGRSDMMRPLFSVESGLSVTGYFSILMRFWKQNRMEFSEKLFKPRRNCHRPVDVILIL